MRITEASEYLGVSINTLKHMADSGRLRGTWIKKKWGPIPDTIEHYNCKILRVGALVKKVCPNDGTIRSGKPYGETLAVLEQKENPYWISCMNGIGRYFMLSDGDWAIEQNLKVV